MLSSDDVSLDRKACAVSRISRPSGFVVATLCFACGCSSDFHTTRKPRPFQTKATLGHDIYGVLCDRIGASALNEDTTSASYSAICHPDETGTYEDHVHATSLPPVSGSAARTRDLAIAKVEALARHRDHLIRAFNVLLPDIEVDDPHADHKGSDPKGRRTVRLHDALRLLTQRLSSLYEPTPSDPNTSHGDALLPSATASLGRFFETVSASEPAQQALAQLGGRRGYRPVSLALGAVGDLLRYPDLRNLGTKAVRLLGPEGAARDPFEQLMRVTHEELRTAKTSLLPDPFLIRNAAIAQPNRPRDNLELLQAVLLSSDPSFALSSIRTPTFIVARDPRGYALIAGTALGAPQAVPTPFADLDQDGLADVDLFGRFIDTTGKWATVDTPFIVPDERRYRPADAFGRALFAGGKPAYEYIDTNQTLVASVIRNLRPLVDPNQSSQTDALMDLIAGAYVMLGDRVPSVARYDADNPGAPKVQVAYSAFDSKTSPVLDMLHAAAQVLGDPESDDFLQLAIQVLRDHEHELARAFGAALEVKRLADQYPDLSLSRDTTIWDEMAQLVSRMAEVGPADGSIDGRSLLEDVMLAIADDSSKHLAYALATFMSNKDRIGYNPDDLNGSLINLSSQDKQPPHIPVDRTKPDRADNRSIFQRSIQLIVDGDEVKACNKAGASVHMAVPIPGITNMPATYPNDFLFAAACLPYGGRKQPVEECGVFEIQNLTAFYLQSMVGKATLEIKDPCMRGLGTLISMDEVLEKSSTIAGLTTRPTYQALSRQVFFGANGPFPMADLDPNRDGKTKQVNRFLSDLMDPVATVACPTDSQGRRRCIRAEDTLRGRDADTIFAWEMPLVSPDDSNSYTFRDAARVVLDVFVSHNRPDLFVDMASALYRHWPSKDHGPECQKKGSFRKYEADGKRNPSYNPTYCAEDGLVRYEALLTKQLMTDVFPAMRDLIRAVQRETIKPSRYRQAAGFPVKERRGTEVAVSMLRAIFSEKRATTLGLTDRNGNRSTLWNDGTTVKPQVTPFDLFANALRTMDDRFSFSTGFTRQDLAQRHAQWLRARSRLVDQFLDVSGSGKDARFRNPMTPKAALVGLSVLREQINAQCSDRERDNACVWTRKDLAAKAGDVLQSPMFAAGADLLDKMRADPSHVEIVRLLQYLLDAARDDEALRAFLVSSVDTIQVLRDGKSLPPLFNTLATLVAPPARPAKRSDGATDMGAIDSVLQILSALSSEPDLSAKPNDDTEIDRYHILPSILGNLTRPIDPREASKTVLDVFVDAVSDINRANSADSGPLTSLDYATIAQSMQDFLVSPTRGMEQLYAVVKNRN